MQDAYKGNPVNYTLRLLFPCYSGVQPKRSSVLIRFSLRPFAVHFMSCCA